MIPIVPDLKNNKINFGLYVVSTPIGNLRDITLRAIDILKKSEYILCEDTRVSKKILKTYNINSKLISNHKFNEKKNVNKIVDLLKSQKIISIISDAGTPTISDPGKIIINECIKNKINIYPIPGATAVVTAVSISGFSEKYFFYGFFPKKIKDLKNDLKNLSNIESSIVFFVSPRKINKIIEYLKIFFTGRKILICREMTKFFEEYTRTNIDDLKPFEKLLKGELTLVISENNYKSKTLNISDKIKIEKMIKTLSIRDITNLISKEKEISKKEIYNYCLSLKK